MSESRLWQLAARKLTQDIDLEELRELEQLLKEHPGLAFKLELHNRYFMLRENEEDKDELTEAGWQIQRKKLHQNFGNTSFTPKASAFKRAFKAIAGIGVLAGLLMVVYFWMIPHPDVKNISQKAVPPKAKDNREVVLADGSKVILNKNSQIFLSEGFGKSNRVITLSGEAYFDVAHNSTLPFIVQAGTVRIRAVGTVFNVRAYADEKGIETSLLRGAVEITRQGHEKLKLLLKPNEKVVVPVVKPAVEAVKKKHENDSYTIKLLQVEKNSGMIAEIAWVNHKLVFDNEPLSQIAQKLEKWYDTPVTINDSRLATEKFTGEFESENMSEVLTALQITYPFHFLESKDGAIMITKK